MALYIDLAECRKYQIERIHYDSDYLRRIIETIIHDICVIEYPEEYNLLKLLSNGDIKVTSGGYWQESKGKEFLIVKYKGNRNYVRSQFEQLGLCAFPTYNCKFYKARDIALKKGWWGSFHICWAIQSVFIKFAGILPWCWDSVRQVPLFLTAKERWSNDRYGFGGNIQLCIDANFRYTAVREFTEETYNVFENMLQGLYNRLERAWIFLNQENPNFNILIDDRIFVSAILDYKIFCSMPEIPLDADIVNRLNVISKEQIERLDITAEKQDFRLDAIDVAGPPPDDWAVPAKKDWIDNAESRIRFFELIKIDKITNIVI